MNKLILFAALSLLLLSCNSPKNSMTMSETPSEWKHTTTIYEVNIRQYTPEGTFKAFEKHLPRLKDMGVKTLWFMPITPIAQEQKKGTLGSQYAAADYTSINPEFGSLEDFKHLVDEAHSMGFKVIIDWVANHTGWDHTWTKTHPEYYLIDPKTDTFQIASGMEDIIELDYSKPQLRRAMIDAMKFWVENTGIDGFRCDLASWVEVDFWQEARAELDQVRPLFWLGEFDELDTPEYGKVFDASYIWNWMHKTKDFNEKDLPLSELKSLLQRYSDIGDNSMRAWFTSNHDENTWNGTEYEKYGVFAKPLAVFSVTWNGVPLIYNGQELPLKTKRLEFFEKDPIPWTSQPELHSFYKTLLELKASNPALRGGDPKVKTFWLNTTQEEKVLAYLRVNGEKEVLTLLNFSKEPVQFELEDPNVKGTFTNVFDKSQKELTGKVKFDLPVSGYLVFER
ncbi:alpha-amylase family glycosyl hydrolase [Chryseobacterium sp. A301]